MVQISSRRLHLSPLSLQSDGLEDELVRRGPLFGLSNRTCNPIRSCVERVYAYVGNNNESTADYLPSGKNVVIRVTT